MTWHPVALSRDIETGTSAGTVLRGQEIALWRDTKGAIHAWEDRCPHRGMKLSFGFVRGDHIACLYHGWEYGADGRCRKIPAHPALEVPASICVKTYAVAEVGGMVLVSTDPVHPPLPDPVKDASPIRSLFLDCPIDHAVRYLRDGGLGDFAEGEGSFAFCDAEQTRLLIGLHDWDGATCALHVTAAGTPPVQTIAKLFHRMIVFRLSVEEAVA